MIQVFTEDGYYIQTQISDFGTKSSSSIKDCKPSDIWFAKKRKSIKTRIILRLNKIFHYVGTGIQKKISDFQNILSKIKGRVEHYVPSLKKPVCKLIDSGELSKTEEVAYSNYSNYDGDIRHLFQFYDWDTPFRSF